MSPHTVRGRRGTFGHGLALCVAGVALGDMDCHFAWQAWHLVTWTVTLRGRRGRRGTYGTGLELMTRWGPAGLRLVAAHFAWQAWHLVTWTVTLRGRRGTVSHGLSLCVAGVALSDMDCHFAWILYFCSFCTLRLDSQWDLDAFCLDMFSQSVTCKQRHVQLHSACCF